MKVDAGRVFAVAQTVVDRLPEPVVRAAFDVVAAVAWAGRIGGVAQLEKNLGRVRPDLDRHGLRRLSLAGMRAYMRYYAEVFLLPRLTYEQISARVRAIGDDAIRSQLEHGSVVAALSHSGNWDLAGAWATRGLGAVVTVAEHLEPEEVFQRFLRFRTDLGMTIIPLEKDGSTFRELLRQTRSTRSIVPLLADRDLSRTGVEVDLFGHRARFAPGPATLALATGMPMCTVTIRHERLHGERRRVAGTRWGVVVDFIPVWAGRAAGEEKPDVATLTQAWVDIQMDHIRRHPEAWHMLQKVFVEDLDADRLARQQAAAPASGQPAGSAEPAATWDR